MDCQRAGYLVAVLSACAIALSGCHGWPRGVEASGPKGASQAGLWVPEPLGPAAGADVEPRRLIFSVTGLGKPFAADTEPVQAKLSASQASLVDALARVARHQPDQFQWARGTVKTASYTVVLADGLVLSRRVSGHGATLTLILDNRGRTARLIVADGRLTHPPYDRATVEAAFAAMGGRVQLLEMGWSKRQAGYWMRVGYYALGE